MPGTSLLHKVIFLPAFHTFFRRSLLRLSVMPSLSTVLLFICFWCFDTLFMEIPKLHIVTVVKLITSTTTQNGLTVKCSVDSNIYETGIKVDDKELDKIDIEFRGPNKGWNYIIRGFKN